MEKTFYTQLLLLSSGVAALLAFFLMLFPQAQVHWQFSIVTVLLFMCTCVALFYAGKSTSKSKSKMAFNSVVSMSVIFKMVISLILLLVYRSVAQPENTWFVYIFLIVYVVYTVYEVVFMTRLAKS